MAITKEKAHEIGVESFIYLYPLVMMDVTRRQLTNIEGGQMEGRGPMNAFSHIRTYPTADLREVVRPNFDTLYSICWLDLIREPMIVSLPDTARRYYLMPMMDMWTDVFAAPGKRTSGTRPGNFAVIPPGWHGALPAEVEAIHAPTPYVWIIGRIQTNGPTDYEAVNEIQDSLAVTPLSRWGRTPQPARIRIDSTVDMETPPLHQVNEMPASVFFKRAAELMKLHPMHITDWSIVARMRHIGIEPGKSFDFERLDPALQRVLESAASDGLEKMIAMTPFVSRIVNGWTMNIDTMGVYGDNYLKRAIVAMAGLGANQPEDAVYPMNVADIDGNPLMGENRYVLRFREDDMPPVDAFWSVTMYDKDGFAVHNPMNRYALGDRDDLAYNPDGSLDIYIQHESPGAEKQSNWLPAPEKGVLGVTMRLYAPRAEVLDGRWAPPPIERVE